MRKDAMKIGIDLGGSHIAIGVVDANGIIIEKVEKRLMAKEKKDIKSSIESYIEENVLKFKSKYKITEIGLAVPGTIFEREILKSVNLGLFNYRLADILEEKLNLPVKIRNDAKCAALAESRYGALKNYKNTVFLTLGTGIGGAAIIDGDLLKTAGFPGCEFGHIVIEKDGLECNCKKRGCFERYASMKAFKNKLREELGLDENTRGQDLLDMIRKNSNENKDFEVINRVVDEFIEYLSIGISNIVNIFEPETIGIGGSFVFFEDVLLEKLRKNILEKNLLFNERDNLKIETAILGNDAGIIGSIL